jgi:hypothetical protein
MFISSSVSSSNAAGSVMSSASGNVAGLGNSNLGISGEAALTQSPPTESNTGSEKRKGVWGRLFSKEGVSNPMASVACGVGLSMAVSKAGQVYAWGTDPVTKAVYTSPGLMAELQALCIGHISCGSVMSACTVDLQNTPELLFYSFAPPILRAATLTSAIEFLFSAKGAMSPLLDYILHSLWTTFCDEVEIVNALQWTSTTLVDENSRSRFSRFVCDFVQVGKREKKVRVFNKTCF